MRSVHEWSGPRDARVGSEAYLGQQATGNRQQATRNYALSALTQRNTSATLHA